MQIKQTHSEGLNRSFEVIFPAKDIEAKINAQLEKIGEKAKVPGFRPGKIPLSILKQRFQTDALSKVLDKCVEESVVKVLKDNDLRPSLRPKVDVKSFNDKEDLVFSIDMEILPTIGDIKYENMSFEKYAVKVPEKTIQQVLENFAVRTRKTHPLKTLRKTKNGDVVIIHFQLFIQ